MPAIAVNAQMAIHILLLACTAGAIIAEIVSIAVPEKVQEMVDRQSDELIPRGFYRLLFILSALYMAAIILMFIAGEERFRIYAFILICLSVAGWVLRGVMFRYRVLQIAESIVCLVILIDTARTIIRIYLS